MTAKSILTFPLLCFSSIPTLRILSHPINFHPPFSIFSLPFPSLLFAFLPTGSFFPIIPFYFLPTLFFHSLLNRTLLISHPFPSLFIPIPSQSLPATFYHSFPSLIPFLSIPSLSFSSHPSIPSNISPTFSFTSFLFPFFPLPTLLTPFLLIPSLPFSFYLTFPFGVLGSCIQIWFWNKYINAIFPSMFSLRLSTY